ncbi:YbhB/YbcL family Raf kinase inhibitor-like protein [Amycolatopsis sp. ATCC 39116]|uniref:YbhB/YbcL family Raf kinase inhibitor-like protein n=1 Tax=Amycolatopsis sp. (strain ATCC 39116 / 75iv2) TaxID=385957 RepID=UPI0002625DE1|nr:YbhB/YbcL family Raf kinase inhibitor-like protein [Amycolatopsis sp. ATCC 39116]
MPDPERAAGPAGDRGTSRGDPGLGEPPRPLAGGLELRTSSFSDNTLIPEQYSYEGGNERPSLAWLRIPDGAAELVLLCEDPDAPAGTFTHWVVTGIAPTSTGLDSGVEGRNDFGERGWGGPRPPVGDEPHRYFFRLYAVDRKLGLGEDATGQDVRAAIEGHVLSTGTIMGRFGR